MARISPLPHLFNQVVQILFCCFSEEGCEKGTAAVAAAVVAAGAGAG